MNQMFFLLILGLLAAFNVSAQNIYDSDNSLKYANYLYNSQQYKMAAGEWERVVFMQGDNDFAKQRLLQSYYKSADYEQVAQRWQHFYGQTYMPQSLQNEIYLKSLLRLQQYDFAFNQLEKKQLLNADQTNYYRLSALLLNKQWDGAVSFARESGYEGGTLSVVLQQVPHLHYKKPFVAGGLSAVVPGLGKVYAGAWKDGLVSLLFVAGNSWQAYRGFRQNGVKSTYGWIFGTLAFGFYSGGVYGSVKAAKQYNQHIDHELYHRVEHLIFMHD